MHGDGGGGREAEAEKTTEHETQLHLQPNIKHLLFTLEPRDPVQAGPTSSGSSSRLSLTP